MNKEQVQKDIDVLKEKNHLTQREMKQAVDIIEEIFIAYGELEIRLEEYRKNPIAFDSIFLEELSNRLAVFSLSSQKFAEDRESSLRKIEELEDEQLARQDAEKDFNDDVTDLSSPSLLDE